MKSPFYFRYLLHYFKKHKLFCKNCDTFYIMTPEAVDIADDLVYTFIKEVEFKRGAMTYPTKAAIAMLKFMEDSFLKSR